MSTSAAVFSAACTMTLPSSTKDSSAAVGEIPASANWQGGISRPEQWGSCSQAPHAVSVIPASIAIWLLSARREISCGATAEMREMVFSSSATVGSPGSSRIQPLSVWRIRSLTPASPESCKAARGMERVLLLGSWFKLNFMLLFSFSDDLEYGPASAPIRPTARQRGSSGWSCRGGDRSW